MDTPENPSVSPPQTDVLTLAMGGCFRTKQTRYGHLWVAEDERCCVTDDEWNVARSAELADELSHHTLVADLDPDFEDELLEWDIYIFQHALRLALEQSCHDGVLLPVEQRAMRLVSCPESMMNPLRLFFAECPQYIQSHLALYNYVAVRLDRVNRTGQPEWRPETGLPAPEEHAFFRPPVLKFRN